MVIRYHDLMGAQHSPASAFTWEEWDLTSRGVPGNVVVEILVQYPGVFGDGDLEAKPGVREVGSALNRTIVLSSRGAADQMATFRVNVDADGVIEIYDNFLLGMVPHCTFKPIGYFTGYGSYTETFINLNVGDGVWEATTLFDTYGIPKESICDVFVGCKGDDGVQEVGIRNPMELGFKYALNDVLYDYGNNSVYIFCATDNTDGNIEVYANDDSQGIAYCMGYWDLSVGYTTVNTSIVPGGAAAWWDCNLAGDGVPDRSIAVMVGFNRENGVVNNCGVREDGSALARRFNVDHGEMTIGPFYWATCVSMCIEALGANAVVELYTSDVTWAWFYCDGYLKTKGQLAAIGGVAVADVDKINSVPMTDILGINGVPV